MKIRVLALDLERTLLSDALHREPRPELHDCLLFCTQRFERVVLFTSVSRPHAFAALQELAGQGVVPQPFLDKLEYVEWEGRYKDMDYIPDAHSEEVLLIDDDEGWVRPDQRGQWIAIAEYDPYLVKGEDREFARVRHNCSKPGCRSHMRKRHPESVLLASAGVNIGFAVYLDGRRVYHGDQPARVL